MRTHPLQPLGGQRSIVFWDISIWANRMALSRQAIICCNHKGESCSTLLQQQMLISHGQWREEEGLVGGGAGSTKISFCSPPGSAGLLPVSNCWALVVFTGPDSWGAQQVRPSVSVAKGAELDDEEVGVAQLAVAWRGDSSTAGE
uniref:Uncharacterized protein n=1 Tax=Eutreptiella gymnastica TaxID=73025 RepID=A0A6U8N0J2_9EUGL